MVAGGRESRHPREQPEGGGKTSRDASDLQIYTAPTGHFSSLKIHHAASQELLDKINMSQIFLHAVRLRARNAPRVRP